MEGAPLHKALRGKRFAGPLQGTHSNMVTDRMPPTKASPCPCSRFTRGWGGGKLPFTPTRLCWCCLCRGYVVLVKKNCAFFSAKQGDKEYIEARIVVFE